ncbi:MAG: hypothetical protein JF588_02655 [Caulobacterales bacterium]|nr:hypothetical protein [Caulobacterales bacterium]
MTSKDPASIIPPLNRVDRATGRTMRERERKTRGLQRRRPSRAQADAYDARIESLTQIHRVDVKRVDWAHIVEQGMVAPAVARDAVSSAARRKLAEYRPSMMDALLGLEQQKRRELTEKVIEAGRADIELYARAKAAAEAHNRMLKLAPEVAALNPAAIAGVLHANGGAAVLAEVCEGLKLFVVGAGRLVAQLDLLEFDALPDEACTVGAAGPLFAVIPPSEQLELQLANACSVVLRVAVELLQVAPVDAVEVVARTCRPGGLAEADMEPVLYVKAPAAAIAKLKLKTLEATPVVTALGPRIDWKPTRGFTPIVADDLGLPVPPAAATEAA